MSAPAIKLLVVGEKPTAADINDIVLTLANKFGSIDGTDLFWPFVAQGDIDMKGNRLLRAREILGNLNLEEYGKDEEAFEQAINDLTSGGLIFIPRNTTITLTRAIKLRANRPRVSLVGCGHSSRIRMGDGADDSVISIDGATRFRISNLFIDGNKNNNGVGHGIIIRNASDFDISNVWIGGTVLSPADAGTSSSAISMENCSQFSVKRNWIRGCDGGGIRMDNCANAHVVENTVRDTSQSSVDSSVEQGDGVSLYRCDTVRVSGNEIIESADDGISCSQSKNMRINGNVVKNSNSLHRGIALDDSEGNPSGVYVNGNCVTGFSTGLAVGQNVRGQGTGNLVRDNSVPITMDKSAVFGLQNNVCMDIANHGKYTMPSSSLHTNIDIGVAGLPIQGIQVTWIFGADTTQMKDSVLGAVYGVTSPTKITVYTATKVGFAASFYLSVFV